MGRKFFLDLERNLLYQVLSEFVLFLVDNIGELLVVECYRFFCFFLFRCHFRIINFVA